MKVSKVLLLSVSVVLFATQLQAGDTAETEAVLAGAEGAISYEQDNVYYQLLKAVRDGNIDQVKQALNNGANVTTSRARHAVIDAVGHERPEILRLLLDHGADVNADTIQGYTALMVAASINDSTGYKQIVQLLLDRGADATKKNSQNKTALDIAKEKGNADIIRLLEAVDPDLDSDEKPVSEEAARQGTAATMIQAQVRGRQARKAIPAMKADRISEQLLDGVASDNIDQVKQALNNGADAKNVVIIVAARRGNPEILRLLLDHGADVNEVHNKTTALMLAASGSDSTGYKQVIQLLLDRGADATRKNRFNRTALDIAKARGNAGVIRLLEAVDPDLDSDEKPVSEAARQDTEAKEVLAEAQEILAGAEGAANYANTELCRAIMLKNVDKLRQALDNGADANTTCGAMSNWTALTMLSSADQHDPSIIDEARLLLDHGANVNAQDKYGRTALAMAAEFHNVNLVKFLLKRRADVNAKSSIDGATALIAACYYELDDNRENQEKTVLLLWQAGANVDTRDKSGQTALDYARKYYASAGVIRILESGRRP